MRRLHRLLGAVALLVGAAAPAAYSSAPADAAGACTARGVTVVVDFGALGGGVQHSCASSGGNAAALFGAAGHRLDRVEAQPSAVCSVDAKPVDPCPQMPPATAYWALFWTNGSTTRWTYASLGVDSLNVPAGGSVGFAWQSSAGNRPPAFAPAVTTVAAPSTKRPKQSRPKSAKSGAEGARNSVMKPATSLSTTPTPTPSAGPSVSAGGSPSSVSSSTPKNKKKRAHAAALAVGSAAAGTTAASPASANSPTISAQSAPISAKSGDGGLPVWVAPVLVIVVIAAGGGVALARRRARG